jgi:hypothetical protein
MVRRETLNTQRSSVGPSQNMTFDQKPPIQYQTTNNYSFNLNINQNIPPMRNTVNRSTSQDGISILNQNPA